MITLLRLCFGVAFLLQHARFVRPKFVKGILDTKEDWTFITRFCFASEAGALSYHIKYPQDYAVQNLLLYYDSATQWPAVYKTDKTCHQKESVLNREHYQIVNLSTWTQDEWSFPQCQDFMRGDQRWMECERVIRFSSTRERWWFVAISNCNSSQGLYMEYNFNMTNGLANDFWFYHFAVDEFYILPTDIGFLLLETFTLAGACVIAIILKTRQMLHVTYKLYLMAQVCECASLFLLCIAYGDYAKTGVGLPLVKLLGEMMTASSILIFTFMLVLIGKGYTITRGRLPRRATLKLSIFMSLYTLTYACLFIYQAKYFDPGEVTYLYESPAGYGLLALRIIGCVWFCYAIYFTLLHYPEKRCFYVVFATFYTFWFLTGPCMILVSNFFVGKWMREKIVNGVEKLVNFLGLFTFMVITRPSAANSTFPYHVRTTQITALGEGDGTAVSLPHNTYEMNNQTYDLFTVQRAREDYNAKRRDPFARSATSGTNRGDQSNNAEAHGQNGTHSNGHSNGNGNGYGTGLYPTAPQMEEMTVNGIMSEDGNDHI